MTAVPPNLTTFTNNLFVFKIALLAFNLLKMFILNNVSADPKINPLSNTTILILYNYEVL